MKRIKLFSLGPSLQDLETEVNDFIEDKSVVDIKFSSSRGMQDILVIYEE